MTSNKPKVLLVMQNVPLGSTFLAAKFIKLSDVLDAHMMVWDKKKNIKLFADKYKPGSTIENRMHQAFDDKSNWVLLLYNILNLFLFNDKVRKFLLSSESSFIERLKIVIYYLPVFKIQPNVIHFEFGTLAKNISILKQLTDAKIAVSFRGYDINYVGLDNPMYYNDIWDSVDGLHFLGIDLKTRAVSRGYAGDKLEAIIPPAIDTSFFVSGNYKKANDKFIIISVGRLTWKKGYEYGIRAIATLKKKGIPVEYRIIGDGQYLQALQFTIHELGLQQEVKLCGLMSPDEIKQQLSQVHVFLHPAISEGFCNAVIEAQAMGVPVVCTDADGLSENITDGETGFVVPKWDVEAMAAKMEWFWNNKEQQNIFGDNGIERAQKYFGLEKQVTSFVEFYNRLYAS